MLPKDLRDKIEARFGEKITSKNCEALAGDIFRHTRSMVGETTLQRCFGFTGDHERVKPRKSTLDILAKYVGYSSFDLLSKDLMADIEISDFSEIESVRTAELKSGTIVEFTYEPSRLFRLSYLGNETFKVEKSENSKLLPGDLLIISVLAEGYELFVADVIRDGRSLGSYHAAKQGGLTSLTLLSP